MASGFGGGKAKTGYRPWDPREDPIVGGNTATGERYTRSGRIVSAQGNYVGERRAPARELPGAYGASRGVPGRLRAASERESARSKTTRPIMSSRPKPKPAPKPKPVARTVPARSPAPARQAAPASPVTIGPSVADALARISVPRVSSTPDTKPARAPARAPVDTGPSYTPAQQAGRDVRGVVNPVVAQIQAEIDRQTRSGMGAIGGYTDQLVRALGGAQANLGAIYDQAQQRQAAVDAALSGGLRTQTNQDADALAGRLEAIGPTGQADQARQMGMGAAGALQGLGSAGVSQLIGEGAAASAYGAKLPEIARLGGLQSANMLQLAGQREAADRIGEVRARVPEMVLARTDQFRQNQAEREKLKLSQQIAAKEFGLDIAKFQQGAANDQARLAQGQARIDLDRQKYLTDLGFKQQDLGIKAARVAAQNAKDSRSGKAGAKGMTAGQYATKRKEAGKAADIFYWGDEKKGVQALDYQTALFRLMRQYSLRLNDAQDILNTYYAPGEEGRPYLSFQQRQQLAKAGIPERALERAMWDAGAAQKLLARL